METWEDELLDDLQGMDKYMDDVQGITIDICEMVMSHAKNSATTEFDRLRFLHFCHENIKEKLQAQSDKYNTTFHHMPKKILERCMIRKEEEHSFFKELSSSINKVKLIDELFKCDELKYDSPPAAIDAKAMELCEKYPLVSERITRLLVEDHVLRLVQLHEAGHKFDLQNWLQSYQAITEWSLISDDLKLLEESKNFQRFWKAEIQNELEAYKWFLLDHGGKEKAQEEYTKYIMDNHERITKLCEKKPYDNENGILNLAAQVVHRAYVIKDVKDEIIRLRGL